MSKSCGDCCPSWRILDDSVIVPLRRMEKEVRVDGGFDVVLGRERGKGGLGFGGGGDGGGGL